MIGFQSAVFATEMYRGLKGKKIQFFFDNPIFAHDFWIKHEKEVYMLCQDMHYADFLKRHYAFSNAIQFPPGGKIVNNLPNEKIYDVVFVGNYEVYKECVFEDEFQTGFFEYMIANPDSTFERGMYEFGKILGLEFSQNEIFQYLQDVQNVCWEILYRDRHQIIEKIVSSGIKLHVFSEKWYEYQGQGCENLIIHPMIYGDEPFKVWAQAKIGLNIMRGHKAGMTERIANIMLCKTCCLSDETVYLKEHFTDGEDIVFFRRTELNELPKKIKYLLEHDEERERIAEMGYKKAMREHTWRQRAEQLLEILNA